MITTADTRILDPRSGEVLAQPGDTLDDEQLYRMEMLAVKMTPEQMLAYARKHSLTMWAMLNGVWKRAVEITGDWITVADWIVPSEIGVKTQCLPASRFTEFDLTA